MPRASMAGGVCLACKFDPDCIYETTAGRSILQCEQFEMGLRESRGPAPEIGSSAPGARYSGEPRGLCANCDHRETCIYPRPEGGVWRCEEYA